jgi:hypothetical protein
MSSHSTSLIVISISVSTILIAVICYCLWRGLQSGVVILASTWRGQVVKISRDENPTAYWVVFSLYLILIPVILWLMIHRVHNLLHGISA